MANETLTRTFRAALFAVVLAAACSCATAARHERGARPTLPFYAIQQQVDDYIVSGAYDADVAAVVAKARAWLDERARKVASPAIVLDIDETSLSNWRAYRANDWARILHGPCDLERGPCGIRAWQEMAQGTAIAPTLALVRRARELRVAVFFVSGRPPALREATERNLREQGYDWDGVELLPETGRFASAVEFKAPVRHRITERGYTILLSMGDQQSDLDGGYAEKTFKLPNPVYYLP